MPVLAERRTPAKPHVHEEPQDVAAAMTARPVFLVARLSGGGASWYRAEVGLDLPPTMLRPSSFAEDVGDDGLTAVYLVPVNEAEDEW